MPPDLLLDALENIFHKVAEWGLSPVVAGGLAVSYWGHPRSTRDIDLAILTDNSNYFESQLRQAGLFPANRRHVADLGFVKVSQWRMSIAEAFIDIDVDFLISDHAYHKLAIERSPECILPGTHSTMRVLTCEDLLLFKAKSGRLIDLADIQVLLDLHRNRLDYDYLQACSRQLELDPLRWNLNS